MPQLNSLFERLQKFIIIVNLEKIVPVASRVEFLGFIVELRKTSSVPE